MRISVWGKAADDLDGLYAWIAKDSPDMAAEVVRRIRARIGRLLLPGFADMGRPGRAKGTRELVEAPYIVVYAVDEERKEISIIAIFHSRQDR